MEKIVSLGMRQKFDAHMKEERMTERCLMRQTWISRWSTLGAATVLPDLAEVAFRVLRVRLGHI